MSDLLKPDQIFAGRYRVTAFLAKGGFGAVYSAEQIDTEAKVALKVLWPHLIDSGAAVEQFKLEARLSNRIGSEHVVRVYDVGQEVGSGKVYLSMELLEGTDFEQLVKVRGPVAPEDAAIYLRQIASALDKAHNYTDRHGDPKPIVHRDLKPENLFLTHREAGEPCVKILDFGLAKVLGESGRISNEFKGTPLFMSYEQAAVGAITPQTDIWAFGLIAFYLLTGRCYWLAAAGADAPVTRIFSEVLSGPMNPASERARVLGATAIPTAAFDEWFARAVTRNTSQRFGSISECAADLADVLDRMAAKGPVRVVSPPDTFPGASAAVPSPDALRTLQSARPPSASTTSPQSFDLASLERRTSPLRGAAVVAFVASLIALGLFLARPSAPLPQKTASSSGPEVAAGAVPRGEPVSVATGADPRLVPDEGAPADGGRATHTRRGEDSVGAGRRKVPPPPKATPAPERPAIVPLPPSEPEEDPYGSR